jgi:hypothetical protein
MTARLLGAGLGTALLLAALAPADRCLAKPPDLPAQQTITVTTGVEPAQADGVGMDLGPSEVPTPTLEVTWPPSSPRTQPSQSETSGSPCRYAVAPRDGKRFHIKIEPGPNDERVILITGGVRLTVRLPFRSGSIGFIDLEADRLVIRTRGRTDAQRVIDNCPSTEAEDAQHVVNFHLTGNVEVNELLLRCNFGGLGAFSVKAQEVDYDVNRGTIVARTDADLPTSGPITWSRTSCPLGCQPSLRGKLVASLLYTVHPLLGFLSEEAADSAPSRPTAAPVPPAEPASSCPYLRQQQQAPPAVTGAPVLRSALENLRCLEQGSEELEKARAHFQAGRMTEGLDCLERVRRLCPGSRLEREADQMLEQATGQRHSGQDDEYSLVPVWDVQGVRDTWDGLWATAESAVRWCEDLWSGGSDPVIPASAPVAPSAGDSEEQEQGCEAGRLGVLLNTRTSVRFINVPLEAVLKDLRGCECVPMEVDLAALQDQGVSLIHPINLCVEGVPFRLVLDLVLRQAGLVCQIDEDVVRITTAQSETGATDHSKQTADSTPVCPRAQALHEQHCAGVREQVDGLMKACHLALADGRFEKAADLAREAHALDPERVEADPIVYKLHLLVAEQIRRKEVEGQVYPAGYSEPRPNDPAPDPKEQEQKPQDMIELEQGRIGPLPDVESLDRLVREEESELGVICVERKEKGCPFAPLVAPLAAEVRDWVEHLVNSPGTLKIGLGLTGVEVQARMVGEDNCYNVCWSGGWLSFYKSPKTSEDEKITTEEDE